MLGLVQVKQVGWFEHDGKLGETRPRQKRDFIENFIGTGEGNRALDQLTVPISGSAQFIIVIADVCLHS